MSKIKIAIVGIGNCASSLIQGIYYYEDKKPEDAIGLMHWKIGDWDPTDIEVVAAFDVDERKVGKTIDEAIFAKPNCTTIFQEEIPKSDVKVSMGHVLDGVAEHMQNFDEGSSSLGRKAPGPKDRIVMEVTLNKGDTSLSSFRYILSNHNL